MLRLEAWLKSKSLANEANNLLCARLMQRKEYRAEMFEWLARKRGMSADALMLDVIAGRAKPMSQSEYAEIAIDPDKAIESSSSSHQ